MKKLLLTSVAMGAVFAVAGAAQAADIVPVVTPTVVTPAPMPEPEHTWTGGYVGGHAGLARGSIFDNMSCDTEEGPGVVPVYFLIFADDEDPSDFCYDNVNFGTLDPTYSGFGGEPPYHYIGDEEGFAVPPLSGYLAGAQIGFNYQFGDGPNGFVIGAEVAHSFANIETQFDAYSGEFDLEWVDRFEISRLTTATLRAGYAFGRVLAYGEVGLALAQASWTDSVGFHDTEMAHGLVWGAGVEVAFGNRLSMFFEYNRVKLAHDFLGEVTVTEFDFHGGAVVGVDSTTNIFKVGFNIGIGGH